MMDKNGCLGLISVVIPAYNAEKTLGRAIESVLAQTYSNIELIVVEDCSWDNTLKIAASYAKKDSRIRVLQNQANLGVAMSRNRGIEEAQGDWIAFLDSDDAWVPSKLKKQAEALQKNPSCSLCFTGSAFENDKGVRCAYTLSVPGQLNYEELLKQNLISCSSVLVKCEVLIKFPMVSDPMIHEDFAAWLKILKDGSAALGINEPLLVYRLSSQSKSGNKLRAARMQWKTYRVAGIGYRESIRYFLIYAWRNLKKYFNILRDFERNYEHEGKIERSSAHDVRDVERGGPYMQKE